MQLKKELTHQSLTITTVAPTVLKPGEPYSLELQLLATESLSWTSILISSEVPFEGPSFNPQLDIVFPVALQPGQKLGMSVEIPTFSGEEDCGKVHLHFNFVREGSNSEEELTLKVVNWLSIFTHEHAPADGLTGTQRDRLIKVVNAEAQNGHIFIADFVSFFINYLNIVIPERVIPILDREFNFEQEGLPVDASTLLGFMRGEKRFFGIDRLELKREEEDTCCDEIFDYSPMREVDNPIIKF